MRRKLSNSKIIGPGRRRSAMRLHHWCLAFVLLICFHERCLVHASDDYYNAGVNDDNNNYSNTDDAASNQTDSATNSSSNYRDDDYYVRNLNDDKTDDDAYKKEQQQYSTHDDDVFHWDANVGFEGVSVMPLSCVSYNNGHMIKFQLYNTDASYQCHFAEIATFVVSIAHFMRAYFNYQALTDGQYFTLPKDAGFLNCVQIVSSSDASQSLYAKIGCMDRETYTSTKLQLHVYKDAQCSQKYDDGRTAREHASRGYLIGDNVLSTKVSFRPPFYSCMTCAPDEVSANFNKQSVNWYDDDFINYSNKKQNNGNNEQEANGDDASKSDDLYDDQYLSANDDVSYDDGGRRQLLEESTWADSLEAYKSRFWDEIHDMKQRRLYDNSYDIGEWNMCQRVYKYGMWCDEDCRSLDYFRSDQWSVSDIFLVVIMCIFMTAMVLLIVAKRLKAQQKARIYGDDQPMPGLPPTAMAVVFVVMLIMIVTLASLKFVSETLVFAVVACVLLFIYMLKLTLFENRRPILLAAPRHEFMVDNPLDAHLFD
ncbi:hypothetical protein MPSEU_000295600 [Mayamaea pseudoterrestris]|nr:hypothetical protein MPSEU_000295600 [Mayamaea pseudoterrestris]